MRCIAFAPRRFSFLLQHLRSLALAILAFPTRGSSGMITTRRGTLNLASDVRQDARMSLRDRAAGTASLDEGDRHLAVGVVLRGHDRDVAHAGDAAHDAFDLGRRNALAADLDDVARAVAEPDPAAVEQRDAVAGAEEAFGVERGRGCLRDCRRIP